MNICVCTTPVTSSSCLTLRPAGRRGERRDDHYSGRNLLQMRTVGELHLRTRATAQVARW